MSTKGTLSDSPELAVDPTGEGLIRGAEDIARFYFGKDAGKAARQRVYKLHEAGEIPTFTMGKEICLRPSTARAEIERNEQSRHDRAQRAKERRQARKAG